MFKMRFSSRHQAKWAMAFIVVFVRIPAGKSHFMSMAGHFTIGGLEHGFYDFPFSWEE